MLALLATLPASMQLRAGDFFTGGDISALMRMEELGAVYRDNGQPGDAIEIMRQHGANCFRIRLFVNPTGQGMVVQDLPYVIALSKRVKAAGGKVMLDFHYSDTWADPGHQHRPEAWRELSFEELESRVFQYTRDSIAQLRGEGVLPELIQIGNEITPGMLWPDGRVGGEFNTPEQWDRFARLLKAAERGVREGAAGQTARVIIHIAAGGDWERTRRFLSNIEKRGVPYEIVGQSFYPWWHGSIEDLRENLEKTAHEFGKDICVVETAYPYRPFTSANKRWKYPQRKWPQTPDGQTEFLQRVVDTVRATPDGHGIGVVWWFPESVPIKGTRIWHDGVTAMFDEAGNALPVLDVFGN